MKNTFPIFFAVLLTVFSACFSPEKKFIQVDPAFGKHISAYTAGMISRGSTIKIQLTEDYKGKVLNNEELSDLFSFYPAVKGVAVWADSRTLEFIPEKPLEPNVFYTSGFHLGKLTKVEDRFRLFKFQFSVIPQTLKVELYGVSTPDYYHPENLELSGKINTTDREDSALIKKTITVTLNGKTLPVTWGYCRDRSFNFTIYDIARSENPGTLVVSWNGKPLGSEQTGFKKFEIPSLADFKPVEIKVRQSPDQMIEINFSDPLLAGQNLNGIISLEGVDNPTWQIEGNMLRVFLPGRIDGYRRFTINHGLKNWKGFKIKEKVSENLHFEEAKPQLRLTGKGNILPNSGSMLFPFEAIGVKAVDVRISKIHENNILQFLQVNDLDGNNEMRRVATKIIETKVDLEKGKKLNLKEWNRFTIDMAKYIKPDPGSIYRIEVKIKKEYAISDCSGEEDNQENNTNNRVASRDAWFDDNNEFSRYYHDDYYSYESDYYNDFSACSDDYYYGKAIGKNILSSDVGIICKVGKDRVAEVFVNNLVDTRALDGVKVDFLNYQKQVLATGITNAQGMVSVKLPKKPFLLVATYGTQKGYLKLEDSHSNSLSKFDVAGEDVQKGVKGFIYTERGVWRPGDSIFVSFMLEDRFKTLPENHPVTFELVNPRGEVIKKEVKTKGEKGHYVFPVTTGDQAPTGYYLAKVSVGNQIYSRNLKVETIKPNRLKIYLDFGKNILLSSDRQVPAKLQVKWLHGSPGKNMDAQVDVTLASSETSFKGFHGYTFDNPILNFHGSQETCFKGPTSEQGEAGFPVDLKNFSNAPGFLKAQFTTKVFEPGGDFSIDRHLVTISPFTSYVGLRTPESRNFGSMLETDVNHWVDVATVSESGAPVSREKVQVTMYNIGWRWWWEHNQDDLSGYLARTSTTAVKDTLINTRGGKGKFRFRIPQYQWGRYLILATDPESGHTTGKVVYVDAPWWSKSNKNINENSNMLNFSTDKDKYLTGENIKITIPTVQGNKLLVCLETGTKVVYKSWVETTQGETKLEIPATGEMCPNVYVHVTLMQPHASTKTDLPIRLYGVIPISVENPSTHLSPQIACLNEFKPGTTVPITVKEKDGKAMTYTLAIVDEGLIDLTRFKTPDPWAAFNAREALGVTTWDLFDQVMAAKFGKVDKQLAVGGDDDMDNGKPSKANRFKPMVRFAGPFYLPAGASKTHKIEIPEYIGSVKVMVVAGLNGAYGNAEKVVAVKKPLMVLATLPRVLGPDETVSLPVNVFALEKNISQVKVEVSTNNLLKINGSAMQTLQFSNPGDEVLDFQLKVAQATGIGKIKVVATSGGETSVTEIEIEVRSPNPQFTDVMQFEIEPNASKKEMFTVPGLAGTREGILEISTVPPFNLEKRLGYLINYPHGCIEQTTSAVFPQLTLKYLMELKAEEKEKISGHIKAGLKRLGKFQTGEGGFSYWPGENYTSSWGTNYAGHFMIEAEKAGYQVNPSLKQRWINYQKKEARDWSGGAGSYDHPHGKESNELIQAYRLYTLALAQNAELGAMNRMRETPTLGLAAKWRLAAAYALVGQPEVAAELIKGLPLSVPAYRELNYGYGSDLRDKAMILETLVLLKKGGEASKAALEISAALNNSNWYSTQETGYSLLALSRFYSGAGTGNPLQVNALINGTRSLSLKSESPVVKVNLNSNELLPNGTFELKNNGNTTLYVKWVRKYVPLAGEETPASSKVVLGVKYLDMKGNAIDVSRLPQGTDFICEVTVENPGRQQHFNEMALSQIFPSGWEIHNSRMDLVSYSSTQVNTPDYQDIRDDRVYSYFQVSKSEKKTYRIQLNATYAGKFYLPSTETEAMYDNTIYARVPGKWVEVVKENKMVGK
jgi:alpha-2-macroglobulin